MVAIESSAFVPTKPNFELPDLEFPVNWTKSVRIFPFKGASRMKRFDIEKLLGLRTKNGLVLSALLASAWVYFTRASIQHFSSFSR